MAQSVCVRFVNLLDNFAVVSRASCIFDCNFFSLANFDDLHVAVVKGRFVKSEALNSD